ncbi:MAG: UDP-4-amino-4,6-dideoxy-N-acetyl-beta-L-altrosamine transaminase [Candidatus Marinimicrobia bacterium]|nr:UDP-4-amino-4,6-dideoxy-N-acetyl-beta-L-altrosamine transaminase [Candidatus Neomarinimicrobiota bacterium]|tara:strand:- start:1308 stop:2483 length:1176 start_codon:yes stop_codon:yes gene_type:complete
MVEKNKYIPYGRQDISDSDIEGVVNVLKSEFITQGSKINEFEDLMSGLFKSNHAIAVNSATSALHIACLALGVQEGDVVWTTANSFVASSNCALYCGSEVDFVDIDIDTYNISINLLEQKLDEAKKAKILPKVLIPVHFAGYPCDMMKIKELSDKYGFDVIEDASHAIGSEINGEPIGSCKWSDITVFSFHPVKIMTTGEGGMALTNCNILNQKMNLLRTHGITRDEKILEKTESTQPWYYEQQLLGFNYRMTDIQASLGITQSERIKSFVRKRNEIAGIYFESLSDINIQLPQRNDSFYSSFHLFVILLEESSDKSYHEKIFKQLRNKGIGVNLHYMPIYLQPYYKRIGFKQGYCKNAESYASRAISLPIYPKLTRKDQEFVIQSLRDVL